MNQRQTDILTEAADSLEQLSAKLRRMADENGSRSAAIDQRNGRIGPIADRLTTFWKDVRLGPVMPVGQSSIDLSSTEGLWELLVLAVLIGARVREKAVEQTFHILKSEGLLSKDMLIGSPDHLSQTRRRLISIFRTYYKALSDRRAKVESLFYNRAHLETAWGGDLMSIYNHGREDMDVIEGHLTQFQQISRTAKWICRTLYVHDIWPDLKGKATWYFDRTSNLPLSRLDLIASSNHISGPEQTQKLMTDYFQGDILPLYMQGFVLCSENNVDTCLTECAVSSWCHYPKESGP